MTEVLARGSLVSTRQPRGPIQGAITECLRIQSSARRQSWVAWLFGQNPIRPDARPWYRAAIGELQVNSTLASLPEGWTVLHPSGETGTVDLEHLVIGPHGVFTITTKNHAGERVWVGDDRLLVNGHRTHHLRDARYEAARASRLLSSGVGESVDVIPLIAIVDPGILSFSGPRPSGVRVLAASQLGRTLMRARPRLTDAVTDALIVTAELLGHWHISEPQLDESLRHSARFDRLKSDVEAAARRRITWLASGALAASVLAALALVAA